LNRSAWLGLLGTDIRPEQVLNDLLVPLGRPKIAAAESCTGGNVAARITSISGSSKYFLGGVVSYDNTIKESLLRVPAIVLQSRGAVSPECAQAMAIGVNDLLGSEVGVSTTGIAGPTGGTERKPVGLVYIGIATPTGTTIHEYRFGGDRTAVISQATDRALQLLQEAVEAAID
jgi:nicotinamide-nucleotide amidase